MLDGLADVAVHSLKDLPTQGPDALVLAAVPPREDVADALIAPSPSNPRRSFQPGRESAPARSAAGLSFCSPGPILRWTTIRGNVETRLNQALDDKLDAVVLAWAGLHRLGLEGHVTERLEPPDFLPAVGQGALGIECRRDDARPREDCSPRSTTPDAHRAVRRRASGAGRAGRGLHDPHGRLGPATVADGRRVLALDAVVFEPDGRAPDRRLAARPASTIPTRWADASPRPSGATGAEPLLAAFRQERR